MIVEGIDCHIKKLRNNLFLNLTTSSGFGDIGSESEDFQAAVFESSLIYTFLIVICLIYVWYLINNMRRPDMTFTNMNG